jgi:membrane-bound lytic murein transglycosylase A
MRHTNFLRLSCLLLSFLALSACEKLQVKPTVAEAPVCACPAQPPEPAKPVEVKPEVIKVPDYGLLKPADWQELDAITKDDVTKAWPAWKLGCASLKAKPAWQAVCNEADKLDSPAKTAIVDYFKKNFTVYRATNLDGTNTG